jgi:hypothetical protein
MVPIIVTTSRPGQAAAAQGEAVVPSPQRAALQGNPQLLHAGKGAAPALQHEGPGLLRDGELPEAQALRAGCLGWGEGAVSRDQGRETPQLQSRDPPSPRPTRFRWATERMRRWG